MIRSGLGRDHVVDALRDPQGVRSLSAAQWDLLVRQARRADLSARLQSIFEAAGLLDSLPDGPAAHFRAAATLARAQHAEVGREIAHITEALRDVPVTVVLLKGAAYHQAGLPPARGRLFSDIDILVPKPRLPEVESALLQAGWATTHHSPYDQRYYRQWMHELPPLIHLRRQTAIDVHHAILPETARLRPDSAKLIAAAVPLAGPGRLAVLGPADMVLHSMVHLLMNDEMSHGLRDLSDLDLLLRHFGGRPGFWSALPARAEELGLLRTLGHGLRAARDILGTPIPDAVQTAAAVAGPPAPLRRLMDAMWRRALRSPHPSTADAMTPLALWALYLRAHALRMPPLLLTRHLFVKAFKLHQVKTARS